MPASAATCEATMSDPLVALVVALALAAYLVHTLVRPEKY